MSALGVCLPLKQMRGLYNCVKREWSGVGKPTCGSRVGDSEWGKKVVTEMLCFVLGNNPVLIQAFTTITAVHSGTEKPKEKRCKQNPSGELVSVFQALILSSPVPLG